MAEEAPQIPADLQQKIQELQGLAQQVQSIARQRSQMELMESESKRALEALEAAPDDAAVYRNLGAILVQDGLEAAKERLRDDLDTLEIRVKRARDQEGQLQERLESLQSEIEQALQG